MKKHFLSNLELDKLSLIAKQNDTVQEKFDDESNSAAETLNALVDEPPLSDNNLPADIHTLRQKIMNHLPTEQGQRSYLHKLRYTITN